MRFIVLIILTFVLGWLANSVYSELSYYERPYSFENKQGIAPSDHLNENDVLINKDRVILNIKNANIASYAATGSMIPLFNENANGIEVIPEENEIKIGDVIAYDSNILNRIVIHRVVDIGEDVNGKYYLVKGDNNDKIDPEKVRFEQIKYLLIGIIY